VGVFGWARRDKVGEALGAAFVCEIMGNLGIVVALKYVSPLVVSVATLLAPLVTALEGLVVGEPMPPIVAWAGMLITLCGTALVVYGASSSKTTVDVGLH
jgi:drug/metabolite transporter (DMT)-like permease